MPATEDALRAKVKELAGQLKQKSTKTTEVVVMALCNIGEKACYVYDIMDFDKAIFWSKSYHVYLMGGYACKKEPGVIIINREGKFRPYP